MSTFPPPPGSQEQPRQPDPGAPYPPAGSPQAQQPWPQQAAPPFPQQAAAPFPQQAGQAAPGQSPYPQPSYAQPAYAQPAYAQPGMPPGWGYPEPPRRSRKGLFIGLGVVGALVLIGGGTVAALAVHTASEMGQYKLVPPSSFQGLTEDSSNPVVQQMMSALQHGDIAGKGGTPVAAAYSVKAGDRIPKIVVDGGYGDVLDPSATVSNAWGGFSRGATGNSVSRRTDETAGPLGGRMQCAIGTYGANGVSVPICAWADHSSVGVVTFIGQATHSSSLSTLDFARDAATTRAFRSAAEVKK